MVVLSCVPWAEVRTDISDTNIEDCINFRVKSSGLEACEANAVGEAPGLTGTPLSIYSFGRYSIPTSYLYFKDFSDQRENEKCVYLRV